MFHVGSQSSTIAHTIPSYRIASRFSRSHRHTRRMRERISLLLGPALSLIVAAIIIVQTIINDPTAYFQEEISAQFGFTVPTGRRPMRAQWSKYSFFRSKAFRDHHDNGYAFQLAKHQENHSTKQQENHSNHDVRNTSQHSYRPFFWLTSNSKDAPVVNVAPGEFSTNTPNNGKFPGEAVVITDYRKDVRTSIEELMNLDSKILVPRVSNETEAFATCRFMDYQYAFYFPHFAQQLFRCWSFWRSQQERIPVFVTGKNTYNWKLLMDNKFNQGMLKAIHDAGVRIESFNDMVLSDAINERSISAFSDGPILQPRGTHFQTTSAEDMLTFRDTVLSSLNISKAVAPSTCERNPRFPRIAILSRRHNRRIKDVRNVADQLGAYYNLSYPIPVAFFEDAPFLNQVGMMASVDILITPHGAQETGIVFMPRCGGVLELLPDKYFFPRFYGTLAATAGIEHAHLYLAGNTSDRIVDVLQRDVGFMYPSIQHIQNGVDLLIERWQECCLNLNSKEKDTENLMESIDRQAVDVEE